MEFRTDGLTVIIEDEKIGMRKLIAKYPEVCKEVHIHDQYTGISLMMSL